MTEEDRFRAQQRARVVAAFGVTAWEPGQVRPSGRVRARMVLWLVCPPYRRRIDRARARRALSRPGARR